ncbi:MAG TPA: putative zinc-binding peptidase [Xanthobacteraceae bacterium]|nr:putative zinc-binding peptidase [Xanthobacteraceae bacterium]
MKLFKCQYCEQLLYFENTVCEKCGHRLGFISEIMNLSALEPQGDLWRALAVDKTFYRFCANAAFNVCNWMIEAGAPDAYCAACRHNRTIPDTGIPANLAAWQKIEGAKHRLFYTLMKLNLPLHGNGPDGRTRLAFDFLASPPHVDGPRVMTGHDNGLITLALEEADDAEREKRRTIMHEPYRTLVGHFRHEVGHYFWDLLVRDGGLVEDCRKIFGDERVDYGAALQAYYANGAPSDWQRNFISAYATSHPWEDFAETWAHYLHIVDTLEMARAFGMYVHPRLARPGELDAQVDFDPYTVRDPSPLIETWIPLSNALNSLNRTMGLLDVYPFILSPPVIEKLSAIHDLIHGNKLPVREEKAA